MSSVQQARWIRVLGVAVSSLILWEVVCFTQPAPEPVGEATSRFYRLVDPATGTTVGSWGMVPEGRSTFLILRDTQGTPCLMLEGDPKRGGRLSIRGPQGEWHYYPAPPSD
jgi:hypothetical protein